MPDSVYKPERPLKAEDLIYHEHEAKLEAATVVLAAAHASYKTTPYCQTQHMALAQG